MNDDQRAATIRDEIKKCLDTPKQIPVQLIEEYNKLMVRLVK
jgi:hypothetical protein